MTAYPFPLPAELVQRLPSPTRDGYRYLDVRVRGKWDGVLVADGEGRCVGVYVERRIKTNVPLEFSVDEIEDIRAASRWNLVLASWPFDWWNSAVAAIVVVSPLLLLLAWLVWLPLAFVSIALSGAAICVLYSAGGYFVFRPLFRDVGCLVIVLALMLLMHWLKTHAAPGPR